MTIIDVRTKNEYDTGHVEGAIHHDIMDIMSGTFPDVSKEEKIILYCESGNRAMMTKTLLMKEGFVDVTSMGGLGDMTDAGYLFNK